MKVTWICNGKLSLCITAETELETSMLKDLFKQPVETQVYDKIVVLDKNLQDTVVITPKIADKP